jgi:hypothetical protein
MLLGVMLLAYVRWPHGDSGFGPGAFGFYSLVAFVGIGINLVTGCIAVGRGESYAGGIALGAAVACVGAAVTLLRLTVH